MTAPTTLERARFCFDLVADRASWAAAVQSLPTSSLYLSWAWGEYKTRKGWALKRVAIRRAGDGMHVGCAQLQTRNRGPYRVVLAQGGIHTRALNDDALVSLMCDLRDAVAPGKRDVWVVHHHPAAPPDVDVALLRTGYSPIVGPGMYTYVVGVESPLAAVERQLSGNWRHNLKRALRNAQLDVRWAVTIGEREAALAGLKRMYAALTERKGFAGVIDTADTLDWIAGEDQFEIVEATLDNEVVAARVIYVANDHVMDVLAASSARAKNVYANYLLMWNVIERAHELGRQFVECGGIDPHRNPGVFAFKKGLGGRAVLLGPRWIYSASRVVRALSEPFLTRAW